jgi:hypothetical protein
MVLPTYSVQLQREISKSANPNRRVFILLVEGRLPTNTGFVATVRRIHRPMCLRCFTPMQVPETAFRGHHVLLISHKAVSFHRDPHCAAPLLQRRYFNGRDELFEQLNKLCRRILPNRRGLKLFQNRPGFSCRNHLLPAQRQAD